MYKRSIYLFGHHIVGAGVFLGALSLYLFTLAPTFTQRHLGVDGGDLLAAAFNLGVPHPTGYPTYVLLVKFFSLLVPVGDFAFRANLLSAVLGAATAALLYYVVLTILKATTPPHERREGLQVAVAVLSAFALASSPLLWSQSLIAEVYSLNALFVVSLILLALRMSLAFSSGQGANTSSLSRAKWLGLFGLLLGLGLGNHLTILLLAPPLVYWLVATLGWRRLVSPWPIAGLVVGLSIYAYLPISASQTPVINWGDADNLEGFMWSVTGKIYQGNLALPGANLLSRTGSIAKLLINQFNIIGLFLGLTGAIYLRQRLPHLFVATAVFMLLVIAYSASYVVRDYEVYMIPGAIVFAVWIGLGIYLLGIEGRSMVMERWPALGRAQIVVPLIVALFIILPGTNISLNYSSQNLRGDYDSYNHYSRLIDSLPSGAVVMANSDDDVFGLWYMRYVDRRREDILVIASPLLQFDWYWDDLHRLFPDRIFAQYPVDFGATLIAVAEQNLGRVPVYTTYEDQFLKQRFTLQKEGDLYRVE